MRKIIESIEKSIENENWYGALIVALTIPDICSKLERPITTTNKRYPEWFNEYRKPAYESHLSGEDCYALRCSYLHEGSSIIEHQKIKRMIEKFSFSPKGSHLITMSGIYVGSKDDGKTMCHLSVKSFCEDMKYSAEKWLEKVKNNEEIQERINEMLKINIVNELYNGACRIE